MQCVCGVAVWGCMPYPYCALESSRAGQPLHRFARMEGWLVRLCVRGISERLCSGNPTFCSAAREAPLFRRYAYAREMSVHRRMDDCK